MPEGNQALMRKKSYTAGFNQFGSNQVLLKRLPR